MATEVGIEEQTPAPGGSRAASSRSSPSATSGCTSPAWAPTSDHEVPVIVRGEGCYVCDEHGKRYLDGLVGALLRERRPRPRGARRGGRSAGRGARLLHQLELRAPAARSSWPRASPSLAPGDLNRVFFTSGGSEAVESAWKLARNYHRLRGEGTAHKLIARELAYHGTTLGALSATGLTALRTPFEPLTPGGVPRAEHEQLPLARRTATRSGRPTRSRSGSSSRARRRSPP